MHIFLQVLLMMLSVIPAFAQEPENDDFVEVEYINFNIAENPLDRIPSYRDRRFEYGSLFSVSYNQFIPRNYDPQYSASSYSDVYEDLAVGSIEVSASFKYNFSLGSISAGIGVGIVSSESSNIAAHGDSLLKLYPIRGEVNLALDNLFDNPVFVPYGIAGVYTVIFHEELAALAYDGNTQVAPYFGGGVLYRLDWLFPNESFNAYKENGQENTFIYLEGRKFVASTKPADPDFSTGIQFGGGLKFEF